MSPLRKNPLNEVFYNFLVASGEQIQAQFINTEVEECRAKSFAQILAWVPLDKVAM